MEKVNLILSKTKYKNQIFQKAGESSCYTQCPIVFNTERKLYFTSYVMDSINLRKIFHMLRNLFYSIFLVSRNSDGLQFLILFKMNIVK